jgi:hypothetical protein
VRPSSRRGWKRGVGVIRRFERITKFESSGSVAPGALSVKSPVCSRVASAQVFGNGSTDSPGGAGDNGDFSCEFAHGSDFRLTHRAVPILTCRPGCGSTPLSALLPNAPYLAFTVLTWGLQWSSNLTPRCPQSPVYSNGANSNRKSSCLRWKCCKFVVEAKLRVEDLQFSSSLQTD